MDFLPFIHAQVRLEYDLDPQGGLLPRPGSSEQALYVVYVYPGGSRAFWRADLPQPARTALAQIDPAQAFERPQVVLPLLAQPLAQPSGVFRAYTLLAPPAPEDYPLVEMDGERFVIRQDGRTAAAAWSVRQDAHSAEAAVETHPSYRRRGFARQATAAWAAEQFRRGRLPLYSHKAENLASQALARSLGLQHFADSRTWE